MDEKLLGNKESKSYMDQIESVQSKIRTRKSSEAMNIMTPQKKDTTQNNRQKLLLTQQSMSRVKQIIPFNSKTNKTVFTYTGCNCTKSRCLKMYCICFSQGKMCDNTCLCNSCQNKHQNGARSEAIVEVITKDPFAFSRNADKISSVDIKCNCEKSNCIKKYCDCYRKGRICGVYCNCQDCKNNTPNIIPPKQQQTKIKKKIKFE